MIFPLNDVKLGAFFLVKKAINSDAQNFALTIPKSILDLGFNGNLALHVRQLLQFVPGEDSERRPTSLDEEFVCFSGPWEANRVATTTFRPPDGINNLRSHT